MFLVLLETYICVQLEEKKEEILQSYDKSPYTNRKVKKQSATTKTPGQNFDYTTPVDRLWMVSWSNNNHLNGFVKSVYEIPTFLLTTQAVKSKGHTFENL